MMYHFKEQGFTLVELLIVLVLIGLTTAMVLPNMWQQFDQAKFFSEKQQLKSLVNYAKQYSVYKGKTITLNIEQNHIAIYEAKTTPPDVKSNNSLGVNNLEKVIVEPLQSTELLIKDVNFSTFTLKPAQYILSAEHYFRIITIELSTNKGKTHSEAIEI